MEPTDEAVAAVVIQYEGKWPSTLYSGVLYYEGYRITILDFARVAQFIKHLLS